jgi:hypothetical protein
LPLDQQARAATISKRFDVRTAARSRPRDYVPWWWTTDTVESMSALLGMPGTGAHGERR